MRQLKTNDVFKMSRILKKINIQTSEISAGTTQDGGNGDELLALAVIQKVAENLYLAQAEVNDFMGDLTGMTGDEFGNLPIVQTCEYLKEFKQLDGLDRFFEYVGKLMKQT